MIGKSKFFRASAAAFMALAMLLPTAAGCTLNEPEEETKYSPIQTVKALAFMDVDGVKVNALALEYEQDMTGAPVSADTYTLTLSMKAVEARFGSGKEKSVTNVYINDKPETVEGAAQGSGSGNYVILELYTDYRCGSEASYSDALSVRVTQKRDITLPDGEVIAKGETYTANYSGASLYADGFEVAGFEGFEFYTDSEEFGTPDGPAFVKEHCFNQQDGLYYDVHLSYALWVPEDWHEGGNYAMVTLENPAAATGTHPLASVLETRSPYYYVTDGQQAVKEAHPGLDGMIVVVPTVTERVNDNGGTPAEYEALVALWDELIETYHINTNYIYGSGQSVGGMVLLETQRNRDNFFAGLLLYEDQWAQNYYVDTLFNRSMASNAQAADATTMHYPRTDENITWDYHFDTDGNKVYTDDPDDPHDPYNMYYLVSDDNILVLRYSGNNLCLDTWNEMNYLYTDLTGDANNGINMTTLTVGNESSLADYDRTNEQLKAFLTSDRTGKRNINAVTFNGGSNGYTARKYDASYEWLLSQSRDSEMARAKLDLNKPFVAAETQIQTEDRKLYFTDVDGNAIYFITGEKGAGTQFYNTAWLNTGRIADAAPGWLPEGMGSWTQGAKVTGSGIVSAQVIEGGKAVAIEYSEDMSNLTVDLKGDKILAYGSTTIYRDDIQIEVDPFTFYDADGNEIACAIKSVYVNSSAATVSGRGTGEGSGCYVIVEFESAIAKTPASVKQRTTLHTDKYIASAYPWKYELR